jgi:hypothetical protein
MVPLERARASEPEAQTVCVSLSKTGIDSQSNGFLKSDKNRITGHLPNQPRLFLSSTYTKLDELKLFVI